MRCNYSGQERFFLMAIKKLENKEIAYVKFEMVEKSDPFF